MARTRIFIYDLHETNDWLGQKEEWSIKKQNLPSARFLSQIERMGRDSHNLEIPNDFEGLKPKASHKASQSILETISLCSREQLIEAFAKLPDELMKSAIVGLIDPAFVADGEEVPGKQS